MNVEPDLAAKLKRLAIIPIALGAVVILAFWAVYVTAAVFNIDLLHHNALPDRTALSLYLIVCAAATVVSVPVVFLSVREHYYLSQHGVQTQAAVAAVSSVGKNGIRPVTYAYTVGGREYTIKHDTPQICIDRFDDSTTVRVVYDPKRPARSHVFYTDVLSSKT